MDENTRGLERQQGELDDLFEEAREHAREFDRQKSKWRELDSLLSIIEKKDEIIGQLEEGLQLETVLGSKMTILEEMHGYMSKRRLEIEAAVRLQYEAGFHNQLGSLESITKLI